MSVSLTFTQNRVVNPDSTFGITTTATSSTGGIPIQIFVYAAATGTYDHVAQIGDLGFPTSPTMGVAWYRSATVTQSFALVSDATNAASTQKTAIQDLVTAYGIAITSFVGSETDTYTG